MVRWLAVALVLLLFPARAAALPGARISQTDMVQRVSYPGLQTLHFEYGPIKIEPGQNAIEVRSDVLKPSVPGYITRFAPNLVYAADHKVPPVDIIHLHHAVWLVKGYPTFAAGEEKTIDQLPQGYGCRTPQRHWAITYMIHDLTPDPTSVYLTYDIDLAPDLARATPVQPLWMDVAGLRAYPVSTRPRARPATRSPTTRAGRPSRPSARPTASPRRRT